MTLQCKYFVISATTFVVNEIGCHFVLLPMIYFSFTNAGIAHFDLIYPDGSTPSKDILMKFLHIAETAPAAVAVHCKVDKYFCDCGQ